MVEYKYDSWGNHAVLDANGADIASATHIGNLNPFRYRGYYYDEETGLYYLNSRYYDPETGRFISPDDVDVLNDTFLQPNGLNLYAYCYNNPVMMTDPDGAFTLTWWQKLLIGLALIVLGAVAAAISGGVCMRIFGRGEECVDGRGHGRSFGRLVGGIQWRKCAGRRIKRVCGRIL